MNIDYHGKQLALYLTPSAQRALSNQSEPLLVEMEMLFSCLIRKRVRFSRIQDSTAVPVNEKLGILFKPVMTQTCSLDNIQGETPVEVFPIANSKPFVPNWLRIDFRRNQWMGEFGYA